MPTRLRRRHVPDAEGTFRYVRRLALMWGTLLAVVVVVGVSFGIWTWLKSADESRAKLVSAAGGALRVSEVPAPSEEEAMTLVRRAMEVRNPSQVESCFRLGQRSAEEVVDFLQGIEKSEGVPTAMNWLGSMNANGLQLEGVLLVYEVDGSVHNRLAFLTPMENRQWKVDFEAFARWVEPSWSDLLEGKAATGRVRVIVAEDTYYNGLYADESQWRCYGMGSPELEMTISGYCRPGTPQAAALEALLKPDRDVGKDEHGRSVRRAVVEITHRQGAEPRQFEITRVLAEDWVVAESSFDENFAAPANGNGPDLPGGARVPSVD